MGAGGIGYRAYDEGVFQTGRGGAYDAWRDWDNHDGPMALVAAAILAANPHNTQAWSFRVTPQRIDLYADRSRNIGAVDPLFREMYVALGTALENMMQAAAANGYRAELTLQPSPGEPIHAASVGLSPGPVSRSALYEQIPHRHTDRSAYRAQPVPASALAQMASLGADLRGTRVYAIPFGGGLGEPSPLSPYSYPETRIALDQNTFLGEQSSAIPLPMPDGSYLLAGDVSLTAPAGRRSPSVTSRRFALAALTPNLALDGAFGGPARTPMVSLRAPAQSISDDLRHQRVLVEVAGSTLGLAEVRLFSQGRLLGHWWHFSAPARSASRSRCQARRGATCARIGRRGCERRSRFGTCSRTAPPGRRPWLCASRRGELLPPGAGHRTQHQPLVLLVSCSWHA